jgi:hypothetical protein
MLSACGCSFDNNNWNNSKNYGRRSANHSYTDYPTNNRRRYH